MFGIVREVALKVHPGLDSCDDDGEFVGGESEAIGFVS